MNLFTIKRLNQYIFAFGGTSLYTLKDLMHEIEVMESQEFMISIPIGGAGSER